MVAVVGIAVALRVVLLVLADVFAADVQVVQNSFLVPYNPSYALSYDSISEHFMHRHNKQRLPADNRETILPLF